MELAHRLQQCHKIIAGLQARLEQRVEDRQPAGALRVGAAGVGEGWGGVREACGSASWPRPPSQSHLIKTTRKRNKRRLTILACTSLGLAAVQALRLAAMQALRLAAVQALRLAAVRALGLAAVQALRLAAARALGLAAVRALGLAAVRALGLATVQALGLAAVRVPLMPCHAFAFIHDSMYQCSHHILHHTVLYFIISSYTTLVWVAGIQAAP